MRDGIDKTICALPLFPVVCDLFPALGTARSRRSFQRDKPVLFSEVLNIRLIDVQPLRDLDSFDFLFLYGGVSRGFHNNISLCFIVIGLRRRLFRHIRRSLISVSP